MAILGSVPVQPQLFPLCLEAKHPAEHPLAPSHMGPSSPARLREYVKTTTTKREK